QTENHPGNCWHFPGSQGNILIQLSVPVIPRAVTMDHVSGSVFHPDSILRASKDFAVYVRDFSSRGCLPFLTYFFFFPLQNELSGVMMYIKLDVLSNWGHGDYTCLYRFRVHGDLPEDGE
ncbi:SUN3 protein, partial [Zapornia atra]|nr:SUN3 protein [Zapornia atra]